jgi:hypothetical protein
MRRRLDAEIVLCCEELESLHCLGGAMLDPLLQFAKDSDLGWARGSIMKVLTDMNSVDYGDDAAVSKRAKGVIKRFQRLAMMAPRALKPVLDEMKPRIEAYANNSGSTSADLVALLNDFGSILVRMGVTDKKYAKLGEILAALRLPTARVLKPALQPQPS